MATEGNVLENQPLDSAPTPVDKPNMPGNAVSEVSPTIEAPKLSVPVNEPSAGEQVQSTENNENLRQQFEQAAKLGREFFAESRQRENKALAPYLNQDLFNAENIKTLRSREQLTPADVEAARNASMAISLQAADQIVRATLPRQRAEQALKPRILEDEIDSLGKIDGMLGSYFRRAQTMIKEGRINEVAQNARQVKAYVNKTSVDNIKMNDQQAVEWAQNVIQGAGKRVRQHRAKAKELWSQTRGGAQFRENR
jgi:hypothetical protein